MKRREDIATAGKTVKRDTADRLHLPQLRTVPQGPGYQRSASNVTAK
jgi:hypothetical protein